MGRCSFSVAIVFLLIGFAMQRAPCAEEAKVDPSSPKVISAPEKWLDLGKVEVLPLAVRPDGRRVVVCGGYNSVLYDLGAKAPLHTWDERFSAASFSRDGQRLLTQRGHEFTVWDANTFEQVCRLIGQAPAWNEPNYGVMSPTGVLSDDGSRVAIANILQAFDVKLPEVVLIYATDTGQLLQTLVAPKDWVVESRSVGSMTFAPDGRRLLVQYDDTLPDEKRDSQPHCVEWDVAAGTPICTFPLGMIAKMSPDGQWIGAARNAAKIADDRNMPPEDSVLLTIWDAAQGKSVREIRHRHPVRDFAFSPNSERVFVALDLRYPSWNMGARPPRCVHLAEWELKSGELLFEGADRPKYDDDDRVDRGDPRERRNLAKVAYSGDGRRRFAIVERIFGSPIDRDFIHGMWGYSVETGEKLPIRSYVFDSNPGGPKGFPNDWQDLFFFPQGDRFIYFGKKAKQFAVCDVAIGDIRQTLPAQRRGADVVAFAYDGEHVFASPRYFASPWDVGRLQPGLSADAYARFRSRFERVPLDARAANKADRPDRSIDSSRLLLQQSSERLELVDVFSREPLWGWYSRGMKYGAAVSADGSRVVAAVNAVGQESSAPRLVLLDVFNRDRSKAIEYYASAVAFHPDGTRFLAATPQGLEELDAQTAERRRTLQKLPGRALAIAYSPDGNVVIAHGVVGHDNPREPVAAEDKGWAMLWDATTEKAILLEGHTAAVTTAAFGPEGTCCATGSLDKTIRLWETATGRPLGILRGHAAEIQHIDYSPRGDRIVSVAEDGAAVWNVAAVARGTIKPAPSVVFVGESSRFPTHRWALKPTDAPKEPWTVVKLPDNDRKPSSESVQQWLMRAQDTVACAAVTTEVNEASLRRRFRDNRAIGELQHASLDGKRMLEILAQEKKAVLRENGQVLSTWEVTCGDGQATISPSGEEVVIAKRLPATGKADHFEVGVYDAKGGAMKRVIAPEGPACPSSINIDASEKTVLLNFGGRFFVMHDFQTGKEIGRMDGPNLESVYSPDGRFLATVSYEDLRVRLYDPTTLELKKTLTSLFPIQSFTFTPDGKRLLVGHSSGYWGIEKDSMTMWDVDQGKSLWTCVGALGRSATFSPDGNRLLTHHFNQYPNMEYDNSMSVFWDTQKGELLCVVLGPASQRVNLAIGEDSDSLRLGGLRGPLIWAQAKKESQQGRN